MNTLNTTRSMFLAVVALLASVSPSFAWDSCSVNHPVRTEVLRRDSRLNRELNWNRGHLNGRYSRLKAEDRGIQHQARVDAALNGGRLTRGEAVHLNREENHLQRQINHSL